MDRFGAWLMSIAALCVFAMGTGVPRCARAIDFEEPGVYAQKRMWAGADLGIPGPLGAVVFAVDGAALYVVGAANDAASAVYSVPVTRDPVTLEVTDLGAATLEFSGNPTTPGLDSGLEFGPAGTLFYPYFNLGIGSAVLAQRPGGVGGAETQYDLASAGLSMPINGLTFSPHTLDPATAFGLLQVSNFLDGLLYEVSLSPDGGGLFVPSAVTLFAALPLRPEFLPDTEVPNTATAIHYVPSGPFAGDLLYAQFDFGELRILEVDPTTGAPIDADSGMPLRGTTNPRDVLFASGLGAGPAGLEFDPSTNDLFVATFDGTPANSILQVGGFPEPGASTTTTTTTLVSTTTTTTLPPGCEVAPSFESARCRIGDLRDRLMTGGVPGRRLDSLVARLQKSAEKLDVAETALSDGKVKKARRQVGKSRNLVRKVGRKLESKRKGPKIVVDDAVRAAFVADATALELDIDELRNSF